MNGKKPFVTKQQVEEIVKTYKTPFHIYDERAIRENARRLRAAFSWNAGFKEYFAVKATPNPLCTKFSKPCKCRKDLFLCHAIFRIARIIHNPVADLIHPARVIAAANCFRHPDVAVFTELGRFMLAPYGHLITQVIHEKHTYKEYIGVDACAVNLMRPAMYGAWPQNHHSSGKRNHRLWYCSFPISKSYIS